MSSSSIGGIDVAIVRGLPQRMRPRVQTWEVPGLNGYGAAKLGNGNAPFEFSTITYADSFDGANDVIDAMLPLQGTIVSIFDDWGDEYENVLLIEGVPSKMPLIWEGNANAVRVTVQWKAVKTS